MIGKKQPKLEQQILRLLDQLIDEASQVSMLVGPYREERFIDGVRITEQLAALCELLVEGRREYVEPTMRQLLQQKLPHPAVMRSFGEFQQALEEYLTAGLAKRRAHWNGQEEKAVEHPLVVPVENKRVRRELQRASIEVAATTTESSRLESEEEIVREEPSSESESQDVTAYLEDWLAQEGWIQNTESPTPEGVPEKTIRQAESVAEIPVPFKEESPLLEPNNTDTEPPENSESGESIIMRVLQDLYPKVEIIAGSPPGVTGISAYVPSKKLAITCGSPSQKTSRMEFACRQLGFKVTYVSPFDMHSPSRIKRSILRSGNP
ncbi:hypothetical protein H1S01_13830 [Heliobacterium chlorum]|uniref:Uncharacterized protein n=1 Tax=Heliobacterium chlorum TaxID=2698 RepID=A0ABR7T660_HELCL|nr:hypothetical protein [Heliobacterium chlorum]MBC9785572.1 hypothetical protein [Heliobacterium chlorum]